MSRQDPGAANGGPVREPGWCECGDIESVHRLHRIAGGVRGSCSASTCLCRRYTPKET